MNIALKSMVAALLVNCNLGCASMYQPDVVNTQDDLITLGLYTGKRGSSLYFDHFDQKSKKICKSGEYELVKESKWPDTLEAEEVKENYHYWVIRCKK